MERKAQEEKAATEAKLRAEQEEKLAAEARRRAEEEAKIPQEYKIVAAKDAAMRSEFKAENERVRNIAAQYNKAKQEALAQEQAKEDAANHKEAERVAIAQARKVARTAAAANIAQPLISGVAVFSAAAVAYNAMSPSSSSSLGPKIIGQKKKKRDMAQVKSDANKTIGEAVKEKDGKEVVDGFVDFLLGESRGSAPTNAPKTSKNTDLLAKAKDEVAKFSEKKDAEDAAAAAAAASSGKEAPKYPKGPNKLRAEAKAREEAAAKAASGTPPVPPPATLPPPTPVSPAAPAIPVTPAAPPAQVSPPAAAPVAPPAQQPAVRNAPAQKSYFPGSGGPPPGKKAGPGSYLDNL